jgi:hypothetical protein
MSAPIIKIKRSSVPGKIPTTSSLPVGEFGINTNDGKVYIQQDQGGVGVGSTVIVVNPWSVGLGSDTYNTFFTNGNVGVGSTSPTSKLDIIGDARISGIISASSYYGDGSNLTNVVGAFGGIGTAGGTVGTGITFLDFRGTGISTVTVGSGIGTINIVGGDASVAISTVAPSNPTPGKLWYNENLSRMFIYYNDGDSSQWVDAAPFNFGTSTTTTTSGGVSDWRDNSLF